VLLTAAIVTVSALFAGALDVDGVVVDVDVADPPLGDCDGDWVAEGEFEGVEGADGLSVAVCVPEAVFDGGELGTGLDDGDAVGNDDGDAVCVPLPLGLGVIEAVLVPVMVGDDDAPAVTDAVLLGVCDGLLLAVADDVIDAVLLAVCDDVGDAVLLAEAVIDAVCDGVLLGVDVPELLGEGVIDAVRDAVWDGVCDDVIDGVLLGEGVMDGVLLAVCEDVMDAVLLGDDVMLAVCDGVGVTVLLGLPTSF